MAKDDTVLRRCLDNLGTVELQDAKRGAVIRLPKDQAARYDSLGHTTTDLEGPLGRPYQENLAAFQPIAKRISESIAANVEAAK